MRVFQQVAAQPQLRLDNRLVTAMLNLCKRSSPSQAPTILAVALQRGVLVDEMLFCSFVSSCKASRPPMVDSAFEYYRRCGSHSQDVLSALVSLAREAQRPELCIPLVRDCIAVGRSSSPRRVQASLIGALSCALAEASTTYAAAAAFAATQLCDWLRGDDKFQLSETIFCNLIKVFIASEQMDMALRILDWMDQQYISCNSHIYSTLLRGCASLSLLPVTCKLYDRLKTRDPHLLSSDFVVCALLHAFGRNCHLPLAQEVFAVRCAISLPDVAVCTAMMNVYAQHARMEDASRVLEYMVTHNIHPNRQTCNVLLNGFSHAGNLEAAQALLSAMPSRFGVQPDAIHKNCMIDMYGRLGRLDDAEQLAQQTQSDIVAWMALLAACRKFTDVARGERTFARILSFPLKELRPHRSGACVLMANIYAQAGDTQSRDRIRRQMERDGVHKSPATSWLQLSNTTVSFVPDDPLLGENKRLHTMHSEMMVRLQQSGYTPDISVVMLDAPLSTQQRSVCTHSEKIAIAYGLLAAPSSAEPLRITQNLRMCSDCHSATKLISQLYEREIVLRDNSCHHYFRKDGTCSCGDYW